MEKFNMAPEQPLDLNKKVEAMREGYLAGLRSMTKDMEAKKAEMDAAAAAYDKIKRERAHKASEEGVLEMLQSYLGDSDSRQKERYAALINKKIVEQQEISENIAILEGRKILALKDDNNQEAAEINLRIEILESKQLDPEILNLIKEAMNKV